MIARLVLFGATGDLAARYLFPALVALHAAGRLPAAFSITGTARDALSLEVTAPATTFRRGDPFDHVRRGPPHVDLRRAHVGTDHDLVARAHRGVGKVGALINEDVSYAAKDVISGRFRPGQRQRRITSAGRHTAQHDLDDLVEELLRVGGAGRRMVERLQHVGDAARRQCGRNA